MYAGSAAHTSWCVCDTPCSQHQTTELVYSASGEHSQPDSVCLVTTASQHCRALPTHQLSYHRVTVNGVKTHPLLQYSTDSLTELSQVLGVITARRALLSLLELNSKCSALVTTSAPNEFVSVGLGAVCSVMIFFKTRYAISQLLKDLNMNYYTAVSPFWFVAVSVCRRSGLLLIAVSPFCLSPFWYRRFGVSPF